MSKEEKSDGMVMNFSSFLVSVASTAMMHLGAGPHPTTGQTGETNLDLARESIDLLVLLKKKTEGNLTDEEAKLLDAVLYDVRMKYLEASKSK